MLLDFGDNVDGMRNVKSLAGDANSGVNRRKILFIESHVDHRANDLNHFACIHDYLQL